MTVVLDSWAVVRYLEDAPPAAEQVAELLNEEEPVISWINLGEVAYVVERAAGRGRAAETIRDLREVLSPELPTGDRVLGAATVKASHAMSYADAFAAATAVALDAPLWTGDPELMIDGAAWEWHDLR